MSLPPNPPTYTRLVRPKRPMSAYLLWLCTVRQQIKAENPGIRITELGRVAGAMWRALPDKSEWHQQAACLREQYVKDLEEYRQSGGYTGYRKRNPYAFYDRYGRY